MAVELAVVRVNERVGGGCHRLELSVGTSWPAPRAGQFAMLSLDDPRFPILPRPFSILGFREVDGEGRLEFLIMPVGTGSGMLCDLREGDTCRVVGPMGCALEAPGEGQVVCVAGGYGVAPFLFLTETWAREDAQRLARTTVVFGARTAERLALADRLEAVGVRVELCTDDGSRGFPGRVNERLAGLLDELRPSRVLTCGPDAMMEAVGSTAQAAGVPVAASLETVMGCGYAVCNGCAVAVDDDIEADGHTYHLACREGTIFDEARLHWNLI